jgi:hypothetical protein
LTRRGAYRDIQPEDEMPKTVVIDELHVTVRVPASLPDADAETVRRTLAGAEFMNRLRRAVRVVIRSFPELATVRVSMTR